MGKVECVLCSLRPVGMEVKVSWRGTGGRRKARTSTLDFYTCITGSIHLQLLESGSLKPRSKLRLTL